MRRTTYRLVSPRHSRKQKLRTQPKGHSFRARLSNSRPFEDAKSSEVPLGAAGLARRRSASGTTPQERADPRREREIRDSAKPEVEPPIREDLVTAWLESRLQAGAPATPTEPTLPSREAGAAELFGNAGVYLESCRVDARSERVQLKLGAEFLGVEVTLERRGQGIEVLLEGEHSESLRALSGRLSSVAEERGLNLRIRWELA